MVAREQVETRAAAEEAPTDPPAPRAPPPSTSIGLGHAHDRASDHDSLGFGPYVRALAGFLTHPNTLPPLTVSIEGEWGSGKSSFMKQLRARLGQEVARPECPPNPEADCNQS